jgi:hypothetical protein
MIDIVLTLVFSVVMLLFMVFPSMKIVAWIEKQITVPEKWHNPLLFGVTIFLSLCIGVFLRFW